MVTIPITVTVMLICLGLGLELGLGLVGKVVFRVSLRALLGLGPWSDLELRYRVSTYDHHEQT